MLAIIAVECFVGAEIDRTEPFTLAEVIAVAGAVDEIEGDDLFARFMAIILYTMWDSDNICLFRSRV